MKAVRQARLELSGGSTPDQLKPQGSRRVMVSMTRASYWVRDMDGLVVCALGGARRGRGLRFLVRPSVQGPVGEVPATAPFSSPLHHRYRRWMGGVSRPHGFFIFCMRYF